MRPGLERGLPWAAGANGAFSATRRGVEVLPQTWLQTQARTRKRFQGAARPLMCEGRPVAGVALHTVPPSSAWKEEEAALVARDKTVSIEPLVDALSAWQVPFGEAGLRCAVAMAVQGVDAPEAAAPTPSGKAKGARGGAEMYPDAVWRQVARHFLRALDPHTKLTTPAGWRSVQDSFTQVVRLGLTFAWRQGRAVVAEVQPGAPPEAQGVRAGDALVAIDGEDVTRAKQARILTLLQRPAGATVGLTLIAADDRGRYQVTLTYLAGREDDVTAHAIAELPGCVRVRIRKFGDGTAGRVAEALRRFRGEVGALKGAVLDMRGNRGGIIPEAVSLLELFRRGGLVGRLQTRDGTEPLLVSRRQREVLTVPLVVLVDRDCASACEFVTASLKDGQRALVVGERTWGKATLQEYLPLTLTKDRLMVTVAMFHSPDGHPIQANGVPPDLIADEDQPKDHERPRGEAALSFHLTPDPSKSPRVPHPRLGAISSCWLAAMSAAAGPPEQRRVRQATAALRCLIAVPGRWGHTLAW